METLVSSYYKEQFGLQRTIWTHVNNEGDII